MRIRGFRKAVRKERLSIKEHAYGCTGGKCAVLRLTKKKIGARQTISPVSNFYVNFNENSWHKTSLCVGIEHFFIYEYATNPSRNFSNLTKHSYGVLRLYECSRNARLLLVSQRSSRKTPRWQPRGDDTQSFRPLVQEERGVLRVRLLAPRTRVNTLFSLWQQQCG